MFRLSSFSIFGTNSHFPHNLNVLISNTMHYIVIPQVITGKLFVLLMWSYTAVPRDDLIIIFKNFVAIYGESTCTIISKECCQEFTFLSNSPNGGKFYFVLVILLWFDLHILGSYAFMILMTLSAFYAAAIFEAGCVCINLTNEANSLLNTNINIHMHISLCSNKNKIKYAH